MPNNEEEIELRTEEVQEILSDIPRWITRWGSTIIMAILLLLLVATWFIKYPDILVSPATIVTENPPVHLVAKTAGRVQLYTKDKAWIKKDSYLVVIENAAVTADVKRLADTLKNTGYDILNNYEKVVGLSNLNLGDLQADFSNLIQAINNYASFIDDDYYDATASGIDNQARFYQNLNEKLAEQKDILANELNIAETKYKNDQQLFSAGVISKQELAQSEAQFLQKKYAYRNAEISAVNNRIQLQENTKTGIDVEQRFNEKQTQYTGMLQESYKQMKSALANWEQQFVIKSPIDGEVSLFKFYSNNQFVNSGEEILTVIPKSGKIIGLLYVPVVGSGKIKVGQRVNLKLDSYPNKEFGMINGRVESISKASQNNTYLVQVSLPQGLKTTYNKQLEFKQEMQAIAEIITEDMRIIERVFNQFKSIFKNNT